MDSDKINTKTAGGLIEFCGYLAEKGLAPGKSMENWKGATRNVFGAVEGEGWEQFSLEAIDLDEYLGRFETLRRAQYKPESLAAYNSRVRTAVEAYLAFLKDGTTPAQKAPRAQRKPVPAATPAGSAAQAASPPAAPVTRVAPSDDLIEFPFPLQSGEMATFRLPKRLEKGDAVRINLFLKSLECEPQAQIPEHTGSDEERIAA
jgi:hypothetical protein